jgi:superfamily II DNA or RNA helicase
MKNATNLSLALTPAAHLILYCDEKSLETITQETAKQINEFFIHGCGVGLLKLGLTSFTESLPPSIVFWQKMAQMFVALVYKGLQIEAPSQLDIAEIMPPLDELRAHIASAPFMRGGEYMNIDTVIVLWQLLNLSLKQEVKSYKSDLKSYLANFSTPWNKLGRVCFHLAENKSNLANPFAFLATYTTGVSKSERIQHLPLGRALEEYGSYEKKSQLLALLLPVQRAAEKSSFLRELVDSSAIFKPLAWQAMQAYSFLQDTALFEDAGIMVRVPNWWNAKKTLRPKIAIAIGNKSSNSLGLNSLLDFEMHFELPGGERLTTEEFEMLLKSSEQLIQFRGQWVQVDSQKLTQVLSHWKSVERQVKTKGLSFAEGLRLIAGVNKKQADDNLAYNEVATWSSVVAGEWLNESLIVLRDPSRADNKKLQSVLHKYLQASLRPYQELGVQWLWSLYNLRLGGCLADDMGLGKTIQVLSLLLLVKYQEQTCRAQVQAKANLLVLPSSLIGNWQAEIERFAPDLNIYFAHSSFGQVDYPEQVYDLVVTTYSMLARIKWITEMSWNIIIIDEAQAIKNPNAKQTQIIKSLTANVRFALTGTPIENSITDLWSLFDFVAPGLLGSNREFTNYHKTNKDNISQMYFALRQLVNPYILRRLKNDKSIINDLPDKTEMQTYCLLTKEQIALYQQAVNDLADKLGEQKKNNIQRTGLVLSYLLRFKQICNHPDQWLGHGRYNENHSGKFLRIQEICETIAEKQEKVLIFTQFKEIIPKLCELLTKIFEREGLFLDGQTPIKERAKLVKAFQEEDGPPFFVLSLKAGGTGLNLTAASHVIHFDRWWNPAVENQATDRAYRLGQKKNVLVHKFICRGTIEEKIDAIINSKKSLSGEIVNSGDEVVLTKLNDCELIKVVSLDIHKILRVN